MSRFLKILLVFLLLSCDKDSGSDCFQTSGSVIQHEVSTTSFKKILVNRDVELIVKEGAEFEVIIETGENLINDVDVIVVDNELQLSDNNSCNYVRDYGITKVFVTAPDLTSIRSSTQYEISSNGVLNYQELSLISEDYSAPGSFTVGDFRIQINSDKLQIVSNNISCFYISGQVKNLFVGFYSGAGIFHGEELISQNVNVYHRGSNDMHVNPQESMTGELLGTGDLISHNNPPVIDIEELYTGELIFQN
ncbi:MAG: DUF2807 domain-containing protein [Flavobacteriaceae bacterium]|nr:DUF2807 domain-containing protein [Bacteroidia bacterium]NNL16498.1 DUF2807 domain-containing protein [Flavobacteriaceae bacterium]